MALLTFSVYVGSAIYTAGIAGPNSIMSEFDVSMTTALVGLTVFVLGYGFSPMWAPLSEFPSIGRLPVCEYFVSLADSGSVADD
jgi:DHA1 family multidrug resistance protein-like MFS transporter